MAYQLGIDFGTSTTKIALRRDDDIPVPLDIGKRRETFMPSVVAYERTDNGTARLIAVGEDAADLFAADERIVVREIKRCLAATGSEARAVLARYPWWDESQSCVQAWSSKLSPEEVVLAILTEAVDRSVDRIRDLGLTKDIDGFSIRGLPARFGCPASAELRMRKVIAEVARRLGFPYLATGKIREEPALASLAYFHVEPEPGEYVLIYDLGGGSFDVAVVAVERESSAGKPTLTVLAADGEAVCGGSDIDEVLYQHLVHRLAREYADFGEDDADALLQLMSPEEQQQVRNQARQAKERLSSDEHVEIAFPPGFLGEPLIALTLDRPEFESLLKKTRVIDRTVNCALRAWRRTRMILRDPGEAAGDFYLEFDEANGIHRRPILKLGNDDLRARITRVLLVGGTTHIPLVRRELERLWGAGKMVSDRVVNPLEAVAVGAAWQEQDFGLVVDRLPFSVLLRSANGDQLLYRAFDCTAQFKTRTDSPRVEPFRAPLGTLPPDARDLVIVLLDPDGALLAQYPCVPGVSSACSFEIDAFGRCTIRNGDGVVQNIDNPYQHDVQKQMCERMSQVEVRRKQAERERARAMETRSIFLEND